jgi:peroxiredoxin
MKKLLTLLSLIAILLLAAACKTYPNEGVREAPEIGAIAPDFTLKDTNGTAITLSDHRGQVVLINFWATWCPPCRQEMPGIQQKFEEHQGDLIVLAIDNDEPAQLVSDFKDDLGLTFNILLDPSARVQIQYQIRSYPTSLFVDPNGMIKFVHIGLMTEQQLGSYLSQMGLSGETALQSN